MCHKLKSVDEEICSRRGDINSLHKQVGVLEKKVSGPTLTYQLAEKEKKIHELRQEVDKLKREYGMAQGNIVSI